MREREALEVIRGDADLIIDTTDLNVHQLTDRIAHHFGTEETTAIQVSVVSFGFKYGIPIDADFVADMRFLPNPYWVPDLRHLDGTDASSPSTSRTGPTPVSSSTASSLSSTA